MSKMKPDNYNSESTVRLGACEELEGGYTRITGRVAQQDIYQSSGGDGVTEQTCAQDCFRHGCEAYSYYEWDGLQLGQPKTFGSCTLGRSRTPGAVDSPDEASFCLRDVLATHPQWTPGSCVENGYAKKSGSVALINAIDFIFEMDMSEEGCAMKCAMNQGCVAYSFVQQAVGRTARAGFCYLG